MKLREHIPDDVEKLIKKSKTGHNTETIFSSCIKSLQNLLIHSSGRVEFLGLNSTVLRRVRLNNLKQNRILNVFKEGETQ